MGCCIISSPNNFYITMLMLITLFTMELMVRPIEGKRHFYLKNEVGGPVIFRCQSGTEDLGYRILGPNETFDHGFNSINFGHLLYFCHFYMDHKDKVFDVYSSSVSRGCSPSENYSDLPHPHCFNGHTEWIIKEDGFYKHCVFYLVQDTICFDTYLPPTHLAKIHNWW